MKAKILALGLVCLLIISCAADRRQNYIKLNPQLNPEIKEAILNGDILIGMTWKQVVASRGEPWKINKTTGKFGIHEQWVMHSHQLGGPSILDGEKAWKYGYIYFENGKVTSWQSW